MIKRFFKQIKEGLSDLLVVWRDEFSLIIHDNAILMLFIVAPLIYPVIYSLIYNNEVAREAKMVVVDYCNSPETREFRRMCDASPDVEVVGVCANMEEAKEALRRREAFGIMVFPREFSSALAHKRHAYVQLYSDMSSLLYYKCFLLTATEVSLEMNKEIQVRDMSGATAREEEVSTTPITYDDVAFFNPKSGFASFLIPGFLMLLIQQTLIIGICALSGSIYDKKMYHALAPIMRNRRGSFRIIFGKALCYMMFYGVMSVYLLWVIPSVFNLPRMGDPLNIIAFMLPYLTACIFFGMSISVFVKEKETAYILVAFTSLIFLFISGLSWPGCAVPWYWKSISYLFPSTFGLQGFVKINSMGATLPDLRLECIGLMVQICVYFVLTTLVYRHRVKTETV
ncbi:MAG: ABC transporter permease [Paludibacteraceae bacterium]|nr:ABC transporter permease [Paludibacteraceae bacterium]